MRGSKQNAPHCHTTHPLFKHFSRLRHVGECDVVDRHRANVKKMDAAVGRRAAGKNAVIGGRKRLQESNLASTECVSLRPSLPTTAGSQPESKLMVAPVA